MASDYVDSILRGEREPFKRKEAAARKFDNRLENFRKSAQALRDATRQLETAFGGMSRTATADKWAMTGTEKNVAFDAKGELVAAPAGRKPSASEPADDAVTETTAAEADAQTSDDGADPQGDPAANQESSDDGQPAWASGNH